MVPAVVPVVNVTVATPAASVVLVGVAKDPPVPLLLQVTVLPEVLTGLPFESANCAVIVTAVPATGLLLLELTRYWPGALATVVMFPLVPVIAVLSVPVTRYVVPAVLPVVNVT